MPRAILELGAVVLLAAVLAWLARRLGLPSLIGFLAAGLVVSPLTPGLVADHGQLELLADLGVVLVLFEAGVEIDLGRLRRSGVLVVAPLQVVLTAGLVAAGAAALGLPAAGALLLGASLALSSSVVVAHIVHSPRRTTNGATERALEDWAAVQDLAGAALTAVALAALGFEGAGPAVAGRLLLYALLAAAAAWLAPRALRAFHADADLLLPLSLGGAITLAGLGAAVVGLPLSLAAFLGGAATGDSAETAAVREHVRPFRELFAALFFVALPTLIDPSGLRDALGWLAFLLAALAAARLGGVGALARAARLPGVRPLQLAVGLGQIGEFSFAIAMVAHDHGALPAPVYEALLVTLVVSIAVTAILVRLGGGRSPRSSHRTAEPPAAG